MEQILIKQIVLDWVDYIGKVKDGYEATHGKEDKLMETFIHQIADGHFTMQEIREFAKIIKTVSDIDFPRYTA